MEADSKKKKKRIIMWSLGMAAAGVLGYFGWKEYKRRKDEKEELPELPPPSNYLPASSGSSFTPVISSRNDIFPLKKGSRGNNVKLLQEALVAKYGKAVLPKYGADGDFGTEMQNALKSKGLPETIDETTFNILVKSRSFDARSIASNIFRAASAKNFSSVMDSLKQMRSASDYAAVSENFLPMRFGGVRQTLVNALMKTFSGEQKQKIQLEFTRMGLKYDGDKWSLSGVPSTLVLITKRPTKVWADRFTSVVVPANTILGKKVAEKKGYILFRSIHNQNFIVRAEAINYL